MEQAARAAAVMAGAMAAVARVGAMRRQGQVQCDPGY